MKQKKTLHIISNSHWDREWGYPFEETRLLLLDFMDDLLELLESDPEFLSFTFDSQVLALIDYLELRPEKQTIVEKHVKAGRLIIGPWYSLPEEYCVNGESLVRNLLIGHRKAESFGSVSKVGYTPFSYGQTSQMPQIYNGFDIDTIIFYRGINTPHSEFVLNGPDGSRLLGMRFGCMSRFSYYFYIYRPVRYGMQPDDYLYKWERGALPFRLANDSHPREHYYVLDPDKREWHIDIIPEQLKKLIRDESEHFTTSHIACMQGFDASNPDPRESEIVKLCQEAAPDHEIKLSNLHDYMAAMREEVKNPTQLCNESRDPGAVGKYTHLFGDVISARTRLKLANHRAEVSLQRKAEPWSAIGSMVGGEYLRNALDRAWILLLKNHPHDTISGAGIDQMEKDSLYRADQVSIISDGVTRRGLQNIQLAIDNSGLESKEIVFTIFNPTPFPRREIISCYIDLPEESIDGAFAIRTTKGDRKPLQLLNQFPFGTLVRNLQDVSLELRSQRFHSLLETDEVPAFGYQTYHITPEESFEYSPGDILIGTKVLENEYLHIRFNSDGTLDMTNKETGRLYEGLHYIEDTGDIGHSWVFKAPAGNEIITSHGFANKIVVEENGPLRATIRVDYYMQIPKGVDDKMNARDRVGMKANTRRTRETKEIVISSRFRLQKGGRRLDVTTTLNNTCENHRMRVVFPTHLDCDVTHAEVNCDVVARDIHVNKDSAYYGKENPTYPMYRFVDMSDGKEGLAILNTGIREYEAMDRKDRPLAITLFRAFTYRNNPVIGRYEVHPEMQLSQCPGEMEWTYAIYPHCGDWYNGVYREAEKLNLPLQAAQAGPHNGWLPKQLSFLEVKGDNLQLSAFKQSEDRPGLYVVRIFNPTERCIDGALVFAFPIKNAWLNNLNEERQQPLEPRDTRLDIRLEKKKIITVEVELELPC